jgi:hypothetical protein
MSPRRAPFLVAAAGALSALTLLLGALALVALNTGGAVGAGPIALRMAAGYDKASEALLAPAKPTPAALDQAAAASRAALGLYPYDMRAWLSLLYVDYQKTGKFNPQSVFLLQRTYSLVPVDRDYGVWRVQFALEHFQQLPPDVKVNVREELVDLWFARKKNNLAQVLKGLRNPVGHLAALLWIQSDELRRLNEHAAPHS